MTLENIMQVVWVLAAIFGGGLLLIMATGFVLRRLGIGTDTVPNGRLEAPDYRERMLAEAQAETARRRAEALAGRKRDFMSRMMKVHRPGVHLRRRGSRIWVLDTHARRPLRRKMAA